MVQPAFDKKPTFPQNMTFWLIYKNPYKTLQKALLLGAPFSEKWDKVKSEKSEKSEISEGSVWGEMLLLQNENIETPL